MEVEEFVSHPRVTHQTSSGSPAPSVVAGTGEPVRIVTTALNVLARYPHGRLQPYPGIGLAAVSATVSGPGLAVSDSSPGLSLLTGVKLLLTERVAVFCEGRLPGAGIYCRSGLAFQVVRTSGNEETRP